MEEHNTTESENIAAETNQRAQELLDKAILSLSEWKELVGYRPRLLRSAPQYVKDALEYYGITRDTKLGRRRTFLKALQLSEKPDEHLLGHGQVQSRIYDILTTLCRDNTKMILLVGPNGSAKSTIWNAFAYALEDYSKTPEGARYTIEWVFPHDDNYGKKVGFAKEFGPLDENITFAFMDDEKLDKVASDIADCPAWLYERASRQKYFSKSPAKYVMENQLSPKSHMILQELINVYKTKKKMLTEYDPDEVLKMVERHIRIRRVNVSKTYQDGIAVIDPGNNPLYLTQKQKYPYGLPRRRTPYLLKNLELPEIFGPLSKASNGLMIMEDSLEGILQFVGQYFNDKRKLNIDGERFTFDIMLVGSINPEKFNLLRQDPEYNRFRTRLEIINVPYLLDYEEETRIYATKMNDLRSFYHIAPHTEELFGLFCVMARLEEPMQNRQYTGYEQSPEFMKLKDKIKKFSLLDKAKIYSLGRLPDYLISQHQFNQEEQNTLERHIDLLYDEYSDVEGRTFSFSYREVDALIDRAMLDAPHGFLSPISLMKKLNDVIRHEKDDYPFLRDTKKDFQQLLQLLDDEYFRIINWEMRDVFRFDYEEQIIKEIETYLVKGLKVIYLDRTVIKNQAGDDITEIFLRDREVVIFGKHLAAEERERFWYNWSAKVQYNLNAIENIRTIFESQIAQARDRMYQEKKTEIEKKLDDMLKFLEGGTLSFLTPEEQDLIKENVDTLIGKGYNTDSARELLGYLRSNMERLVLKS